MTIVYDDVVKAKNTQGEVIRRTSLVYSETFSKMIGSEVYLKNEFEQKTGSFKIRGAYYKIKSLTDEVFTEGLGFDGSSVHGFQEIQESDMIVVPV